VTNGQRSPAGSNPPAQGMAPRLERSTVIRHPLWLIYQWELEKLTAQFRTRLALGVALLGPALFAVGLKFATGTPADTLFGRWVADSGYAVPLVILGFAGAWGFPLLVCLIAGDIFSAEDHYRTWTAVLTRSVSRRSVFGGKVLATTTYSAVAVVLLTVSSLLSGLLSVGHQPIIGLSGNLLTSGQAAGLVIASWASVLPAVLSFATLGVLVSVATRNSLAGILLPTVVGLLLQLLLLISGPLDVVRPYLPGASFSAWLGLFADPAFPIPMLIGIGCSAVYSAVLLFAAWMLFRHRDFPGA